MRDEKSHLWATAAVLSALADTCSSSGGGSSCPSPHPSSCCFTTHTYTHVQHQLTGTHTHTHTHTRRSALFLERVIMHVIKSAFCVSSQGLPQAHGLLEWSVMLLRISSVFPSDFPCEYRVGVLCMQHCRNSH